MLQNASICRIREDGTDVRTEGELNVCLHTDSGTVVPTDDTSIDCVKDAIVVFTEVELNVFSYTDDRTVVRAHDGSIVRTVDRKGVG